MYIPREIEEKVLKSMNNSQVIAIIGPRQCGKSTLTKHMLKNFPNSVYLDLERPSDLQKLENAEWFLSSLKGKTICIDEIQRKPDLFPLLRSLVDEWNVTGSFIILGSASRDLLKQSSESLAGRIVYKRLTPFIWKEISENISIEKYISRGGFPRSLLTDDDSISFEWRENFISTFLERDLIQWRGFTPATMHRLWQMLAHLNGQTIDYSKLADSLGVSSVTIKNYIDLLDSTFMVDVIQPYTSNLGKRLVKAPKVYISDSGIAAALTGLRSFESMIGHPSFGAVWEQIVMSNLKSLFPNAEFFFYRTSNGAEIDFVMKKDNKVYAIECKSSHTPTLSKGNYNAIEDISPEKFFIVSPVSEGWSMKPGVEVVSLGELEFKFS